MGGSAYVDDKEYPEFDNFNIDYPFKHNGKRWKCVEQLYQASKFVDKQ